MYIRHFKNQIIFERYKYMLKQTHWTQLELKSRKGAHQAITPGTVGAVTSVTLHGNIYKIIQSLSRTISVRWHASMMSLCKI